MARASARRHGAATDASQYRLLCPARAIRKGLAGRGTDVALRGVPPHHDEDGEDREEDADPHQASGLPADDLADPPREHGSDKTTHDEGVLGPIHRGLLSHVIPRDLDSLLPPVTCVLDVGHHEEGRSHSYTYRQGRNKEGTCSALTSRARDVDSTES